MRVLTLLVLGLAVMSMTSCTRSSSHSKKSSVATKNVRIGTARIEALTEFLDLPGNVTRSHRARLASPYGGIVTSTPVEAGSLVRRGQLILAVGLANARSRLASAAAKTTSARAAARRATLDNARFKALLKDGAVSSREYERIHERYVADIAALKAAKQAFLAAQNDLKYAEIRAPFPGLLEKRPVKKGDYVAPNQTVAEVVGGIPEIVLHVGRLAYQHLPVGASLEATVSGHRYSAVVYQRIDAANPVTRTYQVKLRLIATRQGLPIPAAGDYAQVEIPVGKQKATVVPQAALIKRAGLTGVFVVNTNNVAEFRLVQPARSNEHGMTAVASGIEAGEQVVLNPPLTLGNGSRVTALGKKKH